MSGLRLLDMACHDGYVSAFVADNFRHIERIDGIEASTHGVAEFNRRMNARGMAGECKQGLAENAPLLFEEGTFDAVLAFEVIEHVPDVDAFLTACERMLKPGGRVYLSTPDGTFGEGGNPHHLRAYRATELADLIRRRGLVTSMGIGEDKITVVSYKPREPRLSVAIYTGPGWENWHPLDISRKGLGGSETAAVRVAESLARKGCVVTVYSSMGGEHSLYKNVMFKPHDTFDPLEPVDLLISSRLPGLFDRPNRAGVTMLWVHDVDCDDELTPKRAVGIDHILGLSEWHCSHLRQRYPWATSLVRQIRNGVHLPFFDPLPWERRAQRVAFTSSPDRGLAVLLELWPRVIEQVPEAVLTHAYAAVYDRIADIDPRVREHRDRCRALEAELPSENVQPCGALTQPQVAELMSSSRVWAHPSWAEIDDVAFQETSCISAMEAQAGGAYAVASGWGALCESVRAGVLVGSVEGEDWRSQMVAEIVRGLTDPEVGEYATTEGPKAAAGLGWDGVADMLLALAEPELPVSLARGGLVAEGGALSSVVESVERG